MQDEAITLVRAKFDRERIAQAMDEPGYPIEALLEVGTRSFA